MAWNISENIAFLIAFLSGMIFSNAVTSLIDGNYVVAFLSFLAVIITLLLKRFFDWSTEEE